MGYLIAFQEGIIKMLFMIKQLMSRAEGDGGMILRLGKGIV